MADGFKPIPRCQPGATSLVSAEYANQLIDILNAIGSGTVAPSGMGSFKLAGGQFILDLSALDKRFTSLDGGGSSLPPGGNTGDVLVKASANNGDAVWSNVLVEMKTKINELISAINNSSGVLTCTENGGTMEMNYPGLPDPFE